ncbi:quinoprotein dehydrogenase-associated putative ABC transporter substrate-binding protein [Roseateles sp. BYS180W]|uniref:Quinoprotein dehydrogenase-associated putative ABC transporter substrate-binding protein n=1 Tax=Roseateles rivi TaxID=3299028 RepID=A0ABW7FX96_9BURK
MTAQAAALALALLLAAACAPPAARAQNADEPEPRSALRVCQDPNNMPFSNLQGEGIENRIAALFGKALGLPVQYYSFPQRMGFVRNTLRMKLPGEDYRCDIIMGVPVGFDQVAQTQPYYRSTYALVINTQNPALQAVRSPEDFYALPEPQRSALRIGLYDRSPATPWVNRHGLVAQAVPYPMLSPNPEQYPGEIIERDLKGGKIDAAVVWGPIAGYFVHRAGSGQLRALALPSEPGVRFDYEVAMGVRYGEKAWQAQVQQLLVSHRTEIDAILREFHVPLLPPAAAAKN